jgi:2,3-bisphosphoglycerate-dependent phosphoglycerate mutase
MQLYYIRHAQSANNALWDQTGASTGRSMDPEVTETGRRQAEILAKFLYQDRPARTPANGRDPHNAAGFHLTHLYCSLMDRAVYTASRIAEACDLPVHAWGDLHEEGGIYLADETTGEPAGQPGRNRAYFEASYARLVLPETLGEDGWWNRPYEVYELRRARARRVVEDLLRRHGKTADRVAMVSHGGFYNHFMAVLLGLPDSGRHDPRPLWFAMSNCAITRIDFEADQAAVIYTNRVDFLPVELIT